MISPHILEELYYTKPIISMFNFMLRKHKRGGTLIFKDSLKTMKINKDINNYVNNSRKVPQRGRSLILNMKIRASRKR